MERRKTAHLVFKTITILKGIHAIVEIVLGVILLILTKEFISGLIISFVQGRLLGDPSNFIVQYISQFGIDLSLGIKLFISIYLIGHGIVNFSLVYALVKRPSFAYPISLVIFIGFIVYQAYSYYILASVWLFLLTAFDILFIGLLFYEYNHHLQTHSFLGKLKLIVKAEVPPIVEIRVPKLRIVNLGRVLST